MIGFCAAAFLMGAYAATNAAGGDIPVKLVGGAVCARGTLAGPRASIPANVLIDLGSLTPLRVHERIVEMLGLTPAAAAQLTLGDFKLTDLRAVKADGSFLDDLTREYAPELGEIPAVAILGLGAFSGQDVQLEIGAESLRVLAPGDTALGDASPSETLSVAPYVERAGRIWMTGRGPGGAELNVMLATLNCDTFVDAARAKDLGAPAGDVETALLGTLDLAREVALRPEALPVGAQIRADVALGTGLLSNFRLTLIPARRTALFERVRPARFPAEEQAYFRARSAGDAAGIQEFLSAHADSRLASEGAELLLSLRLADPNSARAQILDAVRVRAGRAPEDRRSQVVMGLAEGIVKTERADRLDLAGDVLRIAQEWAPRDFNARAGHDIQARLGWLALQRDDLAQARVHLLSAAFGLPRDPTVNFWLGQLYERMGKPTRAWSRYLEAAIAREPVPDAFIGLDRLSRDPDFRATFCMADAADLLEGRVPEFHPATRFVRTASPGQVPAVRLVETFVSLNHPPTMAAELAFEGLREYFAGTDVVFIAYHVAIPEHDPLVSTLCVSRGITLGVESTPTTFFDGRKPVTAEGDDSVAPEVFAAYKSAAEAGHRAESAWRLDGTVAFQQGEIRGRMELDGPAATGDVRLVVALCEKLVLAPGKNGIVLHRNVVRHGFSPPDGYSVSAAAGRRVFDFSLVVKQFMDDLAQRLTQFQETGGESVTVRPTYVDPAACQVAAFALDADSGAILAAKMIDVQIPKGGAE